MAHLCGQEAEGTVPSAAHCATTIPTEAVKPSHCAAGSITLRTAYRTRKAGGGIRSTGYNVSICGPHWVTSPGHSPGMNSLHYSTSSCSCCISGLPGCCLFSGLFWIFISTLSPRWRAPWSLSWKPCRWCDLGLWIIQTAVSCCSLMYVLRTHYSRRVQPTFNLPLLHGAILSETDPSTLEGGTCAADRGSTCLSSASRFRTGQDITRQRPHDTTAAYACGRFDVACLGAAGNFLAP